MSPRKRPSLVEEVREGLLGDLTSGKLAPGAKLPNENDLAERFAVSRSTIR
jgi:DNA-binding FadR family transcriptional regulator